MPGSFPEAEQQAGLPEDRLADLLIWLASQAELPLNAAELAEVLWLARKMPVSPPRPVATRADHKPQKAQHSAQQAGREPSDDDRLGSEQAKRDDSLSSPSGISAPPPTASLLPAQALPQMGDVRQLIPVWLEDPALLTLPLLMLRAMRALLVRAESSHRASIDEEETVEGYVRSVSWSPRGYRGMLVPVLEPLQEPRFELVLVLDGGLSMQLWERLHRDLCRMFRSGAAFRNFKVMKLTGPDGAILHEQLRFIANLERRCLLLLLSDCAGDHWWSGDVFPLLKGWSSTMPMAILQVLPRWMWERSALGLGEPVSLRNFTPAAPTSSYRSRLLRRQSRRHVASPGQAVAVVSCDPSSLNSWSGVVMGDPRHSVAGFLLPDRRELEGLPGNEKATEPGSTGDSVESEAEEAHALQQMHRFRELASPQAKELLNLLAASPVLTLPVMRMVKQALMVSDQTPLAMAEVLLGGVMRPVPGQSDLMQSGASADQWQFDFLPGIRQELLNHLSPYDTVAVVNAVSSLVEQRWNRFAADCSFRAFLTDPTAQAPGEMRGLNSFANVTADIIQRLGGTYADFAAKLRQGARKAEENPWPEDLFTFQLVRFETSQLLRIPEVEASSFTTAHFEEIVLQEFPFETARIKGERISTTSTVNLGYREQLPPANPASPSQSLTMLRIPAGSFLMGSPTEEPEPLDEEGPQHEVTLAEFFLARNPITQAQWRTVANWQPGEGEQPWERQLKQDPLGTDADPRFRGDERPVVNVNWDDAMEFCRRLRRRTGKSYTLASEAQWEYACRAGSTTPFHFGATISPQLANYDASTSYAGGPTGENRGQTTDVAILPANAWGLHDMHGNVWEWCLDRWHGSYVEGDEKAPTDGSAWIKPTGEGDQRRLLRGGSWYIFPRYCRSAYRDGFPPGSFIGFRVCCLPQDLLLDP